MKTKISLLLFFSYVIISAFSSCDSGDPFDFEVNQHKDSVDAFHCEINDYTNFYVSKKYGIYKLTDPDTKASYYFAKAYDKWTFWCVVEKKNNFEVLPFGKSYAPKTFLAVDSNQVVHYIRQEWKDVDEDNVWEENIDSTSFVDYQIEYPSKELRLQSVACEKAQEYTRMLDKLKAQKVNESQIGGGNDGKGLFKTMQRVCEFQGEVPFYDEMTSEHTIFSPEEK